MVRIVKKGSGLLIALFVLAGLAFGGVTALASSPSLACTAPESLGSCPPYDDETCDFWCGIHFQTGGECMPGGSEVCCVCLV